MLNTCSAHFQQASLVCKHTCSHRKATCPRPGSAFVHGRKELRAVCGSTKPCRGQAPPACAEPAAGILHCLQQATRRPSRSLTPDETANVPFTHCTSGISNKHRWQQPQDMRISFHFPSCSFTPRSPITRLRTSASLLRSHARQTLPARDKTQRETTCPLPIYQGPCVQC